MLIRCLNLPQCGVTTEILKLIERDVYYQETNYLTMVDENRHVNIYRKSLRKPRFSKRG